MFFVVLVGDHVLGLVGDHVLSVALGVVVVYCCGLPLTPPRVHAQQTNAQRPATCAPSYHIIAQH